MITVHVLTMPGDNEGWKRQVQKDLTHDRIIQHWEPGIEQNIGLARAKAFRKATTPYVGFADPDDRTKTNAWIRCLDYLESNPNTVLVSTGQAVVSEDLKIIKSIDTSYYSLNEHLNKVQHIHGVTVMRTDAVLQECHRLEEISTCNEWTLSLSLIPHGKIVKLPMVGRYWRQHRNQAHRRCTSIHKQKAYDKAFE